MTVLLVKVGFMCTTLCDVTPYVTPYSAVELIVFNVFC